MFLKLFAVFVGRLGSFSLFCWLSFRCCYRQSRKLFVGCLGSFLLILFLSAILEVSRCFCRLFQKLLAVSVGRLRSFLLFLSAVSEASVYHSCCFVVSHFLAALASRSCCFLAFYGRSSRCFSILFFSFFFSKVFFFDFSFLHNLSIH